LIEDICIDTLTLPDTSGIMSPNLFYKSIHAIADLAKGSGTRIGVHCHNDMGMASANTVMGAVAGATVIEASALGVGERNGLGDIFLVGRLLKSQGYNLKLKVEDTDGFRQYYEFVDRLFFEKTGRPLLNYRTPFFGESIKTHVAGTHGKTAYGAGVEEKFYLNVLCGKHLVRKYLAVNQIPYREDRLAPIVKGIKTKSVQAGRSVTRYEVMETIRSLESDNL
jgi:isopropylmalate/homocitrate/citramalate synthase